MHWASFPRRFSPPYSLSRFCATKRVRIILALLMFSHAAFGAGRVDEFLTVKNWHGKITITGKGSGSTKGGAFSDVWDYGITTTINFQLDTYNPNIQGWTGTFSGTTVVNSKDVATFGNCNETFTQMFDGKLPAGQGFTMILQGDNQYAFYPLVYQVQGATSSVTVDCAPGTQTGTGPVNFSPVLSTLIQNLPATGFALTGSQTVPMNAPEQPESLAFGGDPAVIDVTVTWDIEPGPAPGNEVIIVKDSAFENWRPTAGTGGTQGNSITLTAKLQAKGGGTTNASAAYFKWELTKSSKEPGYAMNAPVTNPNKDFDLKIESGSANLKITDEGAQAAQTFSATPLTESSVTVRSYDWGAFGTIKVTAILADQSELVGHLDGDPAQENVRLPIRSESSLIADIWRRNSGVQDKGDVSDDEDSPQGDGHSGDGFTLYEEYRGFIVNGQHVEGKPFQKDFFVYNTASQLYTAGIKLFASVSGLSVQYQLLKPEFRDDHVMNFNHAEGAHNVDQHGVIIVPLAASAQVAEAVGGPGTPGMIVHVETPQLSASSDQKWVDYMQPGIAHELFHCANVYHHGDAPYNTVQWFLDSKTGNIIETPSSQAVTVLDDATNGPYALPADTVIEVALGNENDPHTGNDTCIMRYDNARGYLPQPRVPFTRYLFKPGETAGFTLCTNGDGTGVNEAGRFPQPRYGPAATGRGNCRQQILINDGVPAPRR
jgi:hypothetical protein